MGILHPVAVHIAVFVRNEFDLARFHRLQGLLGQPFEFEEPLLAELGLYDGVGTLAISDR